MRRVRVDEVWAGHISGAKHYFGGNCTRGGEGRGGEGRSCDAVLSTLSVGVTASGSGSLGFGLCRQTIYLGYRRETKFRLATRKDTDGRHDICFTFPVTHQTHNNLFLRKTR